MPKLIRTNSSVISGYGVISSQRPISRNAQEGPRGPKISIGKSPTGGQIPTLKHSVTTHALPPKSARMKPPIINKLP